MSKTLIDRNKEISKKRQEEVEHSFESLVGSRKRRYCNTQEQIKRTEFFEDYYLLYTRKEKQNQILEKALELACDRIKHFYCSDYCGRLCDDWAMSEEDIKNECKIYYKCWNKECILQQAKEMMKSE